MRLLLFICAVFSWMVTQGQQYENLVSKKVNLADTVRFSEKPVLSRKFQVTTDTGTVLPSDLYELSISEGYIVLKNPELLQAEWLMIRYLPLPDILTQDSGLDPDIVLQQDEDNKPIPIGRVRQSTSSNPFSGLDVSGSITRGLRVGNNQNSVVDSELDLRITGKVSEKVQLRASIQDANVPTQQNGYSQRLDEFDQIFIELFGADWLLRGGDLDLVQDDFYFNRFSKRLQGIAGSYTWESDRRYNAQAAGALVRGIFNISRFTGQEGNQGPYKLTGANGELFILIVSGSERVFVNGVPVQRGENEEYIIDYNAGEIRFNPTFPITSEMRISVEYQYSQRNFTRYVAYGRGGATEKKWGVTSFVYAESDAKNQPLQQELTTEQAEILSDAGDDLSRAVAPSARPVDFTENRILYRREIVDGVARFVFSQDPQEELFSVRFTEVGPNQGDYILADAQAIENIYEYVPPINGVQQGNFAPVVQLFAPTSLYVAGVKSYYKPSDKSQVNMEISASDSDRNRFSDLDDNDNQGLAAKVVGSYDLLPKSEKKALIASADLDYIQENYRNVERTYNIEFNRDWNLNMPTGDQTFTRLGLNYSSDTLVDVRYEFQNLRFRESYQGNRHFTQGTFNVSGFRGNFRASALNAEGENLSSLFNRGRLDAVKGFAKKYYVGTRVNYEDNRQRNKATDEFTALSQKFQSYDFYTGVGDSLAVFTEVGYRYRVNDSLRGNNLVRVNNSHNYYVNARPIASDNSDLRVYANYRRLNNENDSIPDEVSINGRIIYQQKLFDRKVLLNTTYETLSGTIAQQDFTFLEVEPGQGNFTWIDYNGDGVQDLNEFEEAPFQDQATFARILLPNQIFLPTHQNKFSQQITLNPISWSSEDGFKKVLSKFWNQTAYLIDRKVQRRGVNFDLNPFNEGDRTQLGLNQNFRNTFFFNRGKQRYTTSYTYLDSQVKNLQSIGSISNTLTQHQFRFVHKVKESYLLNLDAETSINETRSENFDNRNFLIESQLLRPQAGYLFGKSARVDLFYIYQNKENEVNEPASLVQQNLGVSWSFNDEQKYAINGEIKYVFNDFTGNSLSPVGFQILEGLQPGRNLTWSLLVQKKITDYLDLNLSYQGRDSETAETVHTGSVQLRAYF